MGQLASAKSVQEMNGIEHLTDLELQNRLDSVNHGTEEWICCYKEIQRRANRDVLKWTRIAAIAAIVGAIIAFVSIFIR